MKIDNDVLLILDGSYVSYFCVYSAVSRWKSQYYGTALESIVLPEPGSLPYDELPDLITETTYFKNVLFEVAREKLIVLNNIVLNATGHFYTGSAGFNRVDTLVARDYHGAESFRRKLFPQYKITRDSERAERNEFNHWTIFDCLYREVFPQILPKPCNSLLVEGAEGDDVIACITMSPALKQRYKRIILVSSDHDFCQLHRPENRLRQFTLKGEEVICTREYTQHGVTKKEKISADEALLIKIITGDSSDNIPGIKKRLGPVGAWKLISENAKENLKKPFTEDRAAAVAFNLNRKLIDFNEIPQELNDRILSAFEEKFGKNE